MICDNVIIMVIFLWFIYILYNLDLSYFINVVIKNLRVEVLYNSVVLKFYNIWVCRIDCVMVLIK